MKLRDVLETAKWAEHHFGSLISNSQCPRRDVIRAVKAGLMESCGQVNQCDADGHTLWERREREGFKLTADGRDMLKDHEI